MKLWKRIKLWAKDYETRTLIFGYLAARDTYRHWEWYSFDNAEMQTLQADAMHESRREMERTYKKLIEKLSPDQNVGVWTWEGYRLIYYINVPNSPITERVVEGKQEIKAIRDRKRAGKRQHYTSLITE